MTGPVILDTGPWVALLNRADTHHEWAKQHWAAIRPPLITCEAVISEAFFLLRGDVRGRTALMESICRGVVEVPFRFAGETDAVTRLVRRYSDAPMSFADACLVRLAEQFGGSRVFTLDCHFRVYRFHGRQVIPLINPTDA